MEVTLQSVDASGDLHISCARDRFVAISWRSAHDQRGVRSLDLQFVGAAERPHAIVTTVAELVGAASAPAADAPKDTRLIAITPAGPGSVAPIPVTIVQSHPLDVAVTSPDVQLRRGVGLGFGIGAMAPMIDFDFHPFYGFISGGLLPPAASNGDMGALMFGAGLTFQIVRNSPWQFDVFAHVSPGWQRSDTYDYASGANPLQAVVAMGFGVGFHYNFASGFALGFKFPLMGFSFGGSGGSGSDALGRYYALAYMGAPVFSLGYRF
jgi:hypothetical protein